MPALFQAYIFSKPSLSLGRLEYYADVLALQPPLIQLQVGVTDDLLRYIPYIDEHHRHEIMGSSLTPFIYPGVGEL